MPVRECSASERRSSIRLLMIPLSWNKRKRASGRRMLVGIRFVIREFGRLIRLRACRTGASSLTKRNATLSRPSRSSNEQEPKMERSLHEMNACRRFDLWPLLALSFLLFVFDRAAALALDRDAPQAATPSAVPAAQRPPTRLLVLQAAFAEHVQPPPKRAESSPHGQGTGDPPRTGHLCGA